MPAGRTMNDARSPGTSRYGVTALDPDAVEHPEIIGIDVHGRRRGHGVDDADERPVAGGRVGG